MHKTIMYLLHLLVFWMDYEKSSRRNNFFSCILTKRIDFGPDKYYLRKTVTISRNFLVLGQYLRADLKDATL
jgi:hypothetical protein